MAQFPDGESARNLLNAGYPGNLNAWVHQQLLLEYGTDFLSTHGLEWKPIYPFEGASDRFGDGSLYIVDVPGQLPGQWNFVMFHCWMTKTACLCRSETGVAKSDPKFLGMTRIHADHAQERETIRKIPHHCHYRLAHD